MYRYKTQKKNIWKHPKLNAFVVKEILEAMNKDSWQWGKKAKNKKSCESGK